VSPDLLGPLAALLPAVESDESERTAADRTSNGAKTGANAGADTDSPPDATADPLVDVRDVTVSYGENAVLNDVSLSVAPGEFVGLVGRNGAGKTTLLKAINGVSTPDSGTVRIDGATVGDLSARETSRRVATVPQDTTLAFEFTVADAVEMGRTPYHGRLSTDPDATAAVERALARTDTARFADRTVGSLSGGERQRVVLARALAQETPALVLDEPTASLDVNHQVRTLALVRDLVESEGTAALAAIHDLDLAARFCDRIAVLADGDCLAVGPPDEVLTRDRLRTAFDADAAVLSNPVTRAPTVTPFPSTVALDCAVHVAGSGPAAAGTLATLSAAGATVTAGVLPKGDVAAAVAADLGVETVTAPPFAPIDAEAEAAARDALAGADAVVLAGAAPPSVRALVRDHARVVRVGSDSDRGDETGDGEGDRGIDVAATTGVDRVAETVRGALAAPLEADD
jgi:iron complex transport system ATP-binding protein